MTSFAARTGLLALALAWPAAAPGADVPRPEHPRPDAVRPHWANLNGSWEFRFDADDKGRDAKWFEPGAEGFDRKIVVPYGWESELSGIVQAKDAPKVGWYRRTFRVPADFPADQRIWLRFEAVDHRADVWVNGKHVAEHEGGYTPFEADATDALKRDGDNVVVVRAFDPTDPSLPTGKQVGWYTPTSGIWQTVWLEARPKAYIQSFRVFTGIDPPRVAYQVTLAGLGDGLYHLEARPDDRTIMPIRRIEVIPAKPERTFLVGFRVPDPKLWSPESPHLYDTNLELRDADGIVVDSIRTYFGLREIARGKVGDEPFERVLFNGKPIYLRGALDQSFNPKGVYTAPTDDFLKGDIELAKKLGLNFLRIHIKPDEPRRLYWADKLGLLIMEDMPNTWRQNETARAAWEKTMREVIARDTNHPAIFSWVAFNETWGLGHPEPYKKDKDTQQWVKRMVGEIRKLDPTRLVEDNSPCYYDHVEGSDLNSWHFYIDDYAGARKHIEEVVAKSEPGSPFNYCPGEKMNSAPLINSEYGAVSAGGGDRDVSWGFRDLTTQLRKQPKIQGYVYTELADIEWEHNGFVDYDRTPKDFGYDAFVPGMTVADLQGADFVGFDGPPCIVAKPGEVVRVPVFVSHYSDRKDAPKLKWWVIGTDGAGELDRSEPRTLPVEWTPFGVKEQKAIAVKLHHDAFVGAIALTIEDASGKRIAANFVNVVIRGDKPASRVERIDERSAALRFAPGDYASAKWSRKTGGTDAKAYGRGAGSFVYKIKVPEAVAKAKPESFDLMLELASKAGREKVDWPERVNAQDYPQTDAHKWPSTVEISLGDQKIGRVDLVDDPADARGVLSHLARVEHGSYGMKVTLGAPLQEAARRAIAAGKPLELRLRVPDDAEHPGGLSVFGASTGAYPFDPTLIIHTASDLPADLGVKPDAPVAVEVAAARRAPLLRAGDSNQGAPTEWAYTTDDPGAQWSAPDFDASAWKRGPGGFGTAGTPALQERTTWDTPAIWLRTTVDLPKLDPAATLALHLFHDEDVEIFVNGKRLFRARGYVTAYRDIPLDEAQKALFRPGPNVIAVRCTQTGGGQGVDVGLLLDREE